MRTAALATGVGVPAGDFAGRVAETHARAALLKLSDGLFITLLAGELGRQPRGTSLDLPAKISLLNFLSGNAEFGMRGGVIRFTGSEFSVDLRHARPWRSGINELNFDYRNPAVAGSYRAVSWALEHDGRVRAFRDMASAKLDRLGAAIRTRDLAAAERAIGHLIGLGEGKTPAGDDYLVGVCAALWSCADTRAFAAALRPALVALAAGTSELSRLYLQEAAGGEVSERLGDVAAGICAGGSDDVVGNAVAKALSVGHSSGAAGVFGLLRGYADRATVPFQASADSVLAPAF
jgi:Protein of unknown function (DUF2877)